MLTLKICVGVFSGIFKARMLKLGIHMDNELLYYGIENHTPCSYSSLYLSIFYPVFFVFVFRLLRICVTVFFATYLLLLLYSSALLKQCSGAIVRLSDTSSLFCFCIIQVECQERRGKISCIIKMVELSTLEGKLLLTARQG